MEDWRFQVSPHLRHRMTTKIIEALLPDHEPDMRFMQVDSRVQAVIAYARTVESISFQMAHCKENYFYVLDDKIYQIQSEAKALTSES